MRPLQPKSGSSDRRQGVALIGAGVAACAVCCAGPILGFLAAIGLGTLLGLVAFGAIGLVVGALGLVLLLRKRRRATACEGVDAQPIAMSPQRSIR